ncbi:MAG: DUF421 domain-containing protein [Chitinophagaceae bacterium]|nr:DUF421 domain-containing protein [Chitinophagaceae bacterium]
MEELIHKFFGVGENLTSVQMALRAFVMFFIALILIRVSGMRSFGSKSAFDNIIVIMLGAILSRAVVGASAFVPTVVAGISLCLTHRILAMLSARFHSISNLLKGKDRLLYKDGVVYKKNLLKADISNGDLEEGTRLAGNVSSLEKVKEIRMERSGQISVVKE